MVLFLKVSSLAYCFLNLRAAKPIMPNAKIARVEGSGTDVIPVVLISYEPGALKVATSKV